MLTSKRLVVLNQWHRRIVWFPLGFIMWATILQVFGQFRWSCCTKLTLSQTCLHPSPQSVAWAVASFSHGEEGDVKHTKRLVLAIHTQVNFSFNPHSCTDSCHINQFHTSTHVLESWTELCSSWHFCSEPYSNTPARQMVHVHQKPVSQAEQTSCDKPQTFLRAMFLTMCLSPKCLMPEYNVYVQIRNIQLPALK